MDIKVDKLTELCNTATKFATKSTIKWWENFWKLSNYYHEDDTYGGILQTDLKSFFNNLRNKGITNSNLSHEQREALKLIDFFTKSGETDAIKRKGYKLEATIRLREISQTVIPLTEEEARMLDENIRYYRIQCKGGNLSPKTAERLGLKLNRF